MHLYLCFQKPEEQEEARIYALGKFCHVNLCFGVVRWPKMECGGLGGGRMLTDGVVFLLVAVVVTVGFKTFNYWALNKLCSTPSQYTDNAKYITL